ncbi:hypothetical protein K438DRAFT_2031832 [Mycena galopus ATCC 62051]|nr:hypothetical protein K438DRAFT_2031832 [Mycena galopus ATCC 62051]
MESLDSEDRRALIPMHGGGSLRTPAQLRDASRSAKWSKPPLKIAPPSNGIRTLGGNPFSSGRIRDNHATRGGNVAAQSTALGYSRGLAGQPPHKKARTENGSVSRSRKKSSSSSIETSRPRRLGDPDNTGVIIYNVDDYEDEDMEQPISRGFDSFETDDLELERLEFLKRTTKITSTGNGIRTPGGNLYTSGRATDNHATRGGNVAAQRAQVLESPLSAPDNIDVIRLDADGDGKMGQPVSRVFETDDLMRARRERGDAGASSTVRKPIPVNSLAVSALSDNWEPPSILASTAKATRMAEPHESRTKEADNTLSAIHEPVQMKSQVQTTPNSPQVSTSKQASKPDSLPVEAWSLGRKVFDEPYYLTWTPAGKIIIRSGDGPNVVSKHSEQIDIDMDVNSLSFVPPHDSGDKELRLRTLEKLSKFKSQIIGTQFPSYFRQGGPHGEGDIVIKFNSASAAWADAVYLDFVEWLRGHVDNREKLIGKDANNVNQILEVDRIRSKENISLQRHNAEEGPPTKKQKTTRDEGA